MDKAMGSPTGSGSGKAMALPSSYPSAPGSALAILVLRNFHSLSPRSGR